MKDKVIEYIITATDRTGHAIRSALAGVKNLGLGILRNLMNIRAGFGMLQTAVGAALQRLTKAFKFETMTVQFKTLIGSFKEARKHLKDLQDLGDTPPFSLEAFAQASRTLMVMTQGALGYKNSLEMIGDAAAATGQDINTLAHMVGRAYSLIRDGEPLARATMALQNMGIVTPQVAKELADMQAQGASNAAIWEKLTSSIKVYSGAMAQTEKTAEGLLGAIGSQKDDILRQFGEKLITVCKGGLQLFLDKLNELRESGAIEEWAEKAKKAIYAVIGVFKGLSDEATRTETFGALKDVAVGAFEEATTGAINLLKKAAPIIGGLIAQGFTSLKDMFADMMSDTAAEAAAREQLGDSIYHTEKRLVPNGMGQLMLIDQRVQNADAQEKVDKLKGEILEEMRKQKVAEAKMQAEEISSLYADEGDGTESRFERGMRRLKELGQAVTKEAEEKNKLTDDATNEPPKVESWEDRVRRENEERRVKEQLEAKEREKKQKQAEEDAKKRAEAEEKARIEMEQRIAKKRKDLLEKELQDREKLQADADAKLQAAQAKAQQAWGWYRDRDSWKAQLAEERADAEAQKQFNKDFSRLKSKYRDWRTNDRLSDDDELVKRVALAREEEQKAKEYAAETAENTKRAADALEELNEAINGGE